jgi:CheY-like chemotaxis protein
LVNPVAQQVDVLIVEDNPDEAALAVRALAGCESRPEVMCVENGARAMEFLLGEGAFAGRDPAARPRLVLTDLQMPGMDGLGLLKRMRTDPRTRTIPVVVFSSTREPGDVLACMREGANGYAMKPVDYAAYGEAVAKLGRYWLDVNIVPGQDDVPGARKLYP